MTNTKRRIALAFLSIPLLASCGGGDGGGSNRVSFRNVYDEMKASSSFAATALTLGSDGSYLMFDSNPYNIKGGTSTYINVCHDCTIKCGFSESTWMLMIQTRAIDGVQTDSSNGVNARWTYHPDAGLVCTFSYQS